MDQDVFRKVHPRDFLKRFVDNGIRPDGRTPTTPRRIVLQNGHVNTAVGSAMIKFGRTKVVAGVHARLVTPLHSAADQGMIDVNVEVLSVASSNQRSDRQELASNLSEYVSDLVLPRLDLCALCVESEVLVWRLFLSVYCVDNDGNLEDATLLASMAALLNTTLPIVSPTAPSDDDGSMENPNEHANSTPMEIDFLSELDQSILATISEHRPNHLVIDYFPIPVSFALFDGKALIDPSLEEEDVSDSRISFIFRPNGELRSVVKPGGAHVPHRLYQFCLKQATARVPYIVDSFKEDAKKMEL